MSAERCPYDYAVLRLVPRIEREEFVNAGVILFARRLDFLGLELDEPERLFQRARALCPQLEPRPIAAALAGLANIARGEPSGGPIAALSQSERFHWLTTPRSTLLQPSTVHSGLSEDPRATLARLFRSLVTP
jgi:hypothetical protein